MNVSNVPLASYMEVYMKSTFKELLHGTNDLMYSYPDKVLEEMKLNSAIRDRRIFLCEEVTRESIFKACYLLDRLKSIDETSNTKNPIEIIVDSYGGYCYHGLALISKIISMRNEGYKIITTVNSVAMSMGFMILICGSERRALIHSRMMCHQPSSGTWGKLQDMEEDVEETLEIWERMKKIIIENTSITNEQLEDIKKQKRDWFMWSEEALKYNVIDRII